MFTGLIEYVGTIKGVRSASGGAVLSVETGPLTSGIKNGDSVAVNGVCLTAIAIKANVCDFDVSRETLNASNTGSRKVGDKVNLDLAMSAGGRFGGHIVQGHVDTVGMVRAIEKRGDFYNLSITVSEEVLSLMVKKGSICVEGISLTMASLDSGGFSVAVIPATWRETNLQYMKVGQGVNIEVDILVKAVRKQLEVMLGSGQAEAGSLSLGKLKELGF